VLGLYNEATAEQDGKPLRHTTKEVMVVPFLLSLKVGLPPDESMSLKNDVPEELVLGARAVTLKKSAQGFRLVARGFETADEAIAFSRPLAAAIRLWAAEHYAMATVFDSVAKPSLFTPPLPVPEELPQGSTLAETIMSVAKSKGWDHIDGFFNGPDSVVYEESLNVLVADMSASVTKGHGVPAFALCVQEALGHSAAETLLKDEKMSLVVDLAIAAHKERSPRAKLFGLVSALEAMVDDELRPDYVQKAVDVASTAVKSIEPQDPQEAHELVQLANELGGLRFRSTASRVKRLLEEGLPGETKHGPRDVVVKEILKAQGETRSKMIHGHTDPATLDLSRANTVLSWAIIRLIRHRAALQGDPPVSV